MNTMEAGTIEASSPETAPMGAATVSVDEFQALEQKVLQTVELIKMERAARSAIQADLDAAHTEIAALMAEGSAAKADLVAAQAEAATLREQMQASAHAHDEAAALQHKLAACEQQTAALRQENAAHQRERESVRLRVNSMLSSLDGLL